MESRPQPGLSNEHFKCFWVTRGASLVWVSEWVGRFEKESVPLSEFPTSFTSSPDPVRPKHTRNAELLFGRIFKLCYKHKPWCDFGKPLVSTLQAIGERSS